MMISSHKLMRVQELLQAAPWHIAEPQLNLGICMHYEPKVAGAH